MKIYADAQQCRLIYVDRGAEAAYWDDFWLQQTVPDPVLSTAEFVQVTQKYLPGGSRLLEGGCGLGDKVHGFQLAGYEAVGVDFAAGVIDSIKRQTPQLNVQIGDVRHLPFEAGVFDGYWSLGVIEHFWHGYQPILEEAKRVLRSGGYFFLTFPSMSLLRRLKRNVGQYPTLNSQQGEKPLGFYQFALDPARVCQDLNQVGLKPIASLRRSSSKGVKDDLPQLAQAVDSSENYLPQLAFRALRAATFRLLQPTCGHSTLIVARKG